jgi:hypothetical protein
VQRNFKRTFSRYSQSVGARGSASLRKIFFDYFVRICMIQSIFTVQGADVVEVVGWKNGASFSRASGSQIVTIL